MRAALVSLLLVVLLPGASVWAAEARPSAVPTVRLSTPARTDEVRAALDEALQGDDALARSTADMLGGAGVYATLRALRTLVRHDAEVVRIAALEAVARVALRSDKLAERVHATARDANASLSERVAAVEALAAVGDGGDMDLLLHLASRETPQVRLRAAAMRAMGKISGAKLPYVHARWSYWWKKQGTRKQGLLEKSILAINEEPEGEGVDIYAAVVESLAWLDLPYTRKALKSWLDAGKPELRAIAVRLAGTLRLADLTDDLISVAKRRRSSELAQQALASLKQLGWVPREDVEKDSKD